DLLDASLIREPRHALDQRGRPAASGGVLERRQTQGAGQGEITIAQDLEWHVVTFHELELVGRVLPADPEDGHPQREELLVQVAEAAALRRAASRTGDGVPLGPGRSAGLARAWIDEEHGGARGDLRPIHPTA